MNIDPIIDTLNEIERKTKDSKEKTALRAAVGILYCIDLIGFNLLTLKKLTDCAEKELCEKEKENN